MPVKRNREAPDADSESDDMERSSTPPPSSVKKRKKEMTADKNTDERKRLITNFAIIECGKIVFMHKIRTTLKNVQEFLNDLSNKQKIERLKVNKVLSQEQFDLLYVQSPDVPELEQFDIALLIVLIRTFCCPAPHDDKIWNKGSIPDSNDMSLTADMVRLRNLKNDIQEVVEEEIDEKRMNISEIFLRIGKDIPGIKTVLETFYMPSQNLNEEEVEAKVDQSLRQWDEMEMEKAFET